MIRLLISCAILCASTGSLLAQMADFRSEWASVSGNLIAGAAKLPESDYTFRPTPEVRSFAQLVGHIANAQFAICGQLAPDFKAPTGVEKLTSKTELLRALKYSVSLCTTVADRVTDADAAQPVKMFGRDRAKITVLWFNLSHSNEHYGNMVTYLRLKGVVPPSSGDGPSPLPLYFDKGHGQSGPPPDMAEIERRAGFHMLVESQPITADALKLYRVLYLRAPSKAFSATEKDSIIGFVKGGGSLLLVTDEEQRLPIATTGLNDLIAPFGMKLTPDTPYLHNCGAIAKAGEINAADREVPYSGGRAVEGGTPFAYQLDKDGKPAQAFAAWKKVDGGGRIVVMGEGMVSLFLGETDGKRLSGVPRDPQNTTYWGKDSAIFMQEVLAWLVKK